MTCPLVSGLQLVEPSKQSSLSLPQSLYLTRQTLGSISESKMIEKDLFDLYTILYNKRMHLLEQYCKDKVNSYKIFFGQLIRSIEIVKLESQRTLQEQTKQITQMCSSLNQALLIGKIEQLNGKRYQHHLQIIEILIMSLRKMADAVRFTMESTTYPAPRIKFVTNNKSTQNMHRISPKIIKSQNFSPPKIQKSRKKHQLSNIQQSQFESQLERRQIKVDNKYNQLSKMNKIQPLSHTKQQNNNKINEKMIMYESQVRSFGSPNFTEQIKGNKNSHIQKSIQKQQKSIYEKIASDSRIYHEANEFLESLLQRKKQQLKRIEQRISQKNDKSPIQELLEVKNKERSRDQR